MKIAPRVAVGLAAGCVTAVVIALAATGAARSLWPEYAAAEPEKSYSLIMLVARLVVAAACTIGAACVTTIIARDIGQAAFWLGVLFLAVSLPNHLYRTWADYPVWYHLLYLSCLVPLASLTGLISYRCAARDARRVNARAKS